MPSAQLRNMSKTNRKLALWFKVALCFLGALLLTLLTWLLIANLYEEAKPDPTLPPVSASPTPPQTTAEAPLECQNGGSYISQPRGCLCPDQWKGLLCNESNSCSAQSFPEEKVSFPSIVAGNNANSIEVCPGGTSNAGIPRATVFCSKDLTLSKPLILNCETTLTILLEEIQTQPSEEKVLEVASSTQLITSKPETLKKDNISSVAEIVVKILNNTQVTNNTEVTNAAVTTVSQLLEAPANEIRKDATQSLTKQMESFSLEGTNIAQKSIAVQSVELLPEESTGVMFTALKLNEQNDTTFVSNSINVENNVSQFTVNPSAEIQLFVNATGRTNTTSPVRIGFVLYQNDKFFKSDRFKSERSFSRKIISGNIPSTHLYNVELAVKRQDNLSFSLHDFACVFWNYSQEDWDTAGCEKISTDEGFLRCICNHTTNFAMLMSFRQNYTYAKPLETVSIVGCALSIAGLIVTIIFQLVNKPKNTQRSSAFSPLVIHLCTAMLVFYIIFIAGVANKTGQEQKNNPEPTITKENHLLERDIETKKNDWCTAATALMHYFLLATFLWTAVIAGEMYMKLIRVFSAPPRHYRLLQLAIGWGIPAIIAAVTMGATYPFGDLRYRQEEFCWLAALNDDHTFDINKPMLWAFVVPIGLILIFNIGIFLAITIMVICSDRNKPNSTRKVSPIKKIGSTLSVALMLGTTWVIGYLLLIQSDDTTANIFGFVFCLLNATQGLQMFVLYTLKSEIFLKQVTKIFNKLSAPRIYIHSDKYYMIKHHVKTINECYKLHETTTNSMEFTLSTTTS